MKSFEWANPSSIDEAVQLLAPRDANADPDEQSRPMGGGQDLLTTMKESITRPPRVVNLKTIKGLDGISFESKRGLRIGALVTIEQLAENADVIRNYPGLAEAAHSVAVPQIRNLGTVAGNLCQRPRCWYYRLESVICLKKGGSTCYAADGENKYHAIFGGGPSYIVHPSDLAPMLMALNAVLHVQGPGGNREVPVHSFFTLPSEGNIRRENVLNDGEIITEITVPDQLLAARSTYLKFKERASLDFAMASVAAAVNSVDGTVREARVVLGGVAPIPWRVPKVEAMLVGKSLDGPTLASAAELALDGAKPLAKNGYKIPLTKALVRRALAKCGSMA
ncbi:MAG: xanthine dehydrogenase family protein subunit M [Phycisphaerae bacterium]|nr:xanthine dehydrogenase family protein subunit M [Phycisphaerae bacterium]